MNLAEDIAWPEIKTRSLYREDPEKPYRRQLISDVPVLLSNGERIRIPAGFITDFRSAPAHPILSGIVNAIVERSGAHDLAVLIHDWLYVQQYSITGGLDWKQDRKFADMEMLYWLRKSGCSELKSKTMLYAVRLFGKKWWKTTG